MAKTPPEEAEIEKQNGKEQNAAIQEDNSKTKNTKKGNIKKPGTRRKLNAAAEKIDEAPTEEVAIPEVDVKENGEAHVAEVKQKKRNAGKTNAAMNGKVEAKGKQKKGQVVAASIDEKEATKDVTAENKTTEMNVASEIDGSDRKASSLSQDDNNLQINEKTSKIDESKEDSMKVSNLEIQVKEEERSGSFICV